MPQLQNNWVTEEAMVRSRAWRTGYESFRLGQPPEYAGHGSGALAYEYGRLTAAYLRGQGLQLRRLPTSRPVNDHYVPQLAKALSRCAALGAVPRPGG